MYCKKCKTEYKEGDVFCQECGERIDGQNSQTYEDDTIQFGNGVKAWLFLIMLSNLLSVVVIIIIGLSASVYVKSVPTGIIIVGGLCTSILMFLGSLIILETKKRMGFYLIVVACVIAGIDYIIAGSVAGVLIPIIFPIVTYAILSKYWFYME